MKKLFILFLVLSSNLNIAQESVLLRLNYEKGATYDVAMHMTQDMGAIMSMGMDLHMDIKILDIIDDVYESEMKFTKMKMDVLQGGVAMNFDSSKSEDDLDEAGKMMKTQMAPMLKALIFVKGNNLGEVLEAKVTPNIPGVEDIANKSSNVIYPKEALILGSTWTMSKSQKGMEMNFVYVVKSILKDKIVLDLSGDVLGIATGKISGNMHIDRLSGIPENTLIDMHLSVNSQELKSKIVMTMVKK